MKTKLPHAITAEILSRGQRYTPHLNNIDKDCACLWQRKFLTQDSKNAFFLELREMRVLRTLRPEVEVNYRWYAHATFYISRGDKGHFNLNTEIRVDPDVTIDEVEAFFVKAYKDLGGVPDILNS